MIDQVLIEGLRVQAVIGVLAWERQIEQPLLVDVVLGVDTHAAAASDDLADAVNYALVAERISSEIRRLQAQLIETLANHLCSLLLAEFPAVQFVQLTLRKPMAVHTAQAVGVRIERHRDAIRHCDRL